MCFKKEESPQKKEFYNKLVNAKGTPLNQVLVVEPRPRKWYIRYRAFLVLIFVFTILTYVIATSKHGILRINSQIKVIPSDTDWKKYAGCIAKQTGNCCLLPLVSFIHPPDIAIALLAKNGVGAEYLRYLVEQSTRVLTGSQECDVSKPTEYFFHGDCAGPYHYKHYAFTLFKTPQAIVQEIGYKPTHLIHLTRNPFHALVASYGYANYGSYMKELKTSDFIGNNSQKWLMHAQNFASEWVLEYDYVNAFSNSTLRVYYEDLQKDRAVVLDPVLQFIQHSLLQSSLKSLECGMENTHVLEETKTQVKGTDIYSPELIKTLCKSFGPYWNENKWGANICL